MFDKYREIVFWFLLLGSWQLLASLRAGYSAVGAAGTGAFLLYAGKSLGKVGCLGMDDASWEPASTTSWWIAVASGSLAGLAVFATASVAGQDVKLSGEWSVQLLQVTLGPIVEELVFRGYVFALLRWSARRVFGLVSPDWTTILTAAVLFALAHVTQSGVGWLQLACIAATGTLYGWIRCRSGSTAPAAASHAAYNLTLCGAASISHWLSPFKDS